MQTDQIKSIFFSQYLHQDVIVLPCFMSRDPDKICQTSLLTPDLLSVHKDGSAYLLLRDIDQLTDEEYIDLAFICINTTQVITKSRSQFIELSSSGWDTTIQIEGAQVEIIFNPLIIHVLRADKIYTGHLPVSNAAYDYLRAKGVLIPFTYIDENGKPQTLQPDEIIAKGWAKVQPSNVLDN